MHTPCSPKVIAESPRFPVTRTNNRTEVYFTFPQRQLSLRSPFNSLRVEQGGAGGASAELEGEDSDIH